MASHWKISYKIGVFDVNNNMTFALIQFIEAKDVPFSKALPIFITHVVHEDKSGKHFNINYDKKTYHCYTRCVYARINGMDKIIGLSIYKITQILEFR
jgi:hypothetical protein